MLTRWLLRLLEEWFRTVTGREDTMFSWHPRPCVVCKEPCRRIEINYQTYVHLGCESKLDDSVMA